MQSEEDSGQEMGGMVYDKSQVYRSNGVGGGNEIGSMLSDQSQVFIHTGKREGQEMGYMLFVYGQVYRSIVLGGRQEVSGDNWVQVVFWLKGEFVVLQVRNVRGTGLPVHRYKIFSSNPSRRLISLNN